MSTETHKKDWKILKPPPLPRGKTIAVISPAGPADNGRLDGGLRELARRGYPTKVGEHARGHYAYLSARDAERLEDLIKAFADPTVRAVMCSRGGYGSNRLLSSLPYEEIAGNPKIFVGFSDLTALNWALFARCRLVTFTGPLVCEFGEGLPESAMRSFTKMMAPTQPPSSLWPGPLRIIRPGRAVGPLFPGCLSIIVSLLGTPFLPDLTGGILLLEDTGEKPYQVDRMLLHLKNAGILEKIAGLIIGRMVDCWPKSARNNHLQLEDILLDITSSNPVPIYFDLPYGHHPDRLTLPVGVKVEVTAKGSLRLLEDPLDRRARGGV